MIELMDLSSAIQLACGFNFAGAVIMDNHRRLVDMHMEVVHYARQVVGPRVISAKAREDVEHRAAAAEAVISSARFGTRRNYIPHKIRNLKVFCFLVGVVGTVLLVLPAFMKPCLLGRGWAVLLLLGLFAPVPAALLSMYRWWRRNEGDIVDAKKRLHDAVSAALAETPHSETA